MYIFALFHTLWLEVFGFQHHRPYLRWNLHYLSLSVCLMLVSCPRTRSKWLKRSTKKFCQGTKLMLSTTVTIVIKIIVNIVFLRWNFSYGTPLFKAGTFISEHKIWKNVHITFASVTFIKGTVTPLFRGNWDTLSVSQNSGFTSIWINVLRLWDFNAEFCRDISSSWFFMHCLST